MKSLLISTSQQEKLIQNETERRRTLRLLQTRQIEKERAAQLRQTVADEKKKQTYLLINQLQNEWVQEKVDLHDNLEYQFRENLMEMGKGHQEAADQPDYEQEWLKKTVDNDARAVERGHQALDKLHVDMMQNENERNLHILHRKAALELEKIRAQRVAKLPVPEDPLRDLQTKPTTIVTVHDPYNFTTSRYHLEERLVTKEDDQEGDAAQDAVIEQERVDTYVSDKQRLWNEQQEKARVRGDNALKREVLDNAYDNVLDELGKLERQDRERRQKEIHNLPKSIFIPPWRREEEREDRQRHMETAFEQVYQENHRKQPIPIVLMNEDEIPDEEDAASDRTLVADNEEEAAATANPHPEYRMASVTPSANTLQVADEMHDDEEATLADPTIMTLQTPLPEQQQPIKQQNINRLMEKIERQRQAAQNRSSQPIALVTPTIKTPKRLVVSPGYAESSTSADSSVTQPDIHEEQSSANTTTAEIEERRTKLEFRKQALEEQIRLLSARANLLPQNTIRPMVSSSSDVSIESLLKNLRMTNYTASAPSSSASSMYAGKRQTDDHAQFAQAVQAIISSDESQLQTSSSGIAIEDDERSHETTSEDAYKGRALFDKYESHSSEDRDHSLEDLISRLVAAQQQSNNKQYQDDTAIEPMPLNAEIMNRSLIIDDLVDDVLSSMSSLSANTPVDQRSASPEIAQLLSLNRNTDSSQEFHTNRNEENRFYEEKRLIEQELELIRRERENLLTEHEKYRQQTITSSAKKTALIQPPPPPSLLRAKLNIVASNEAHELSTIQEVDTPVSSRNTSVFHHRSPLKSSFDLQQLERISSADSSSSSSSVSIRHDILASQISSIPLVQQQQQQLIPQTGLERDDSGISLVDGPRSSATSRTTLAGGNGGGGGKSSSSGIQSLLPTRQPRVRTITNETTTNTSTSTNLPIAITTPRSNTESDDQSISSISKKWRDILANECLPQLPQIINMNKDNEPQLTHSLGFGSSNVEELHPSSSSKNPNEIFSSSQNLPTQEQFLRSQYANEQCDLMSLIKVHEYLTKQQHPSSTMTVVDQLMPSSSTPPVHHRSCSTLTSVTYRSSLAKQAPTSGPPVSTPSHHSFSSSEMPFNHFLQDKNERRNSVISDIHHLANSPNTFETSITSNSSSNSNKHHDTLSYLIEQNQRAMQRLISNHKDNPTEESTTFFSSASLRVPDYESGQLTTMSSERIQQKSTLMETGSLSTLDFPSAILYAEEHPLFETVQMDCKVDSDDRGILDEPSLTLLSNSYRSLTTTTGQISTAVIVQSTSQQKKKQCSSPLSTGDDKTSACSTPALSPIKNEPLVMMDTKNRHDTSTPIYLAMPAISRNSPLLLSSSTNSSIQLSSQKQNKQSNSDDISLLSFERHELSAGHATLMTSNDHDELKSLENYSPLRTTTVEARFPATTNADWSYFVTVGEGLSKELEKPAPSSSSSSSPTSSSSSSSSSNSGNQSKSQRKRHVGGLEFFINGEQQATAAPQVVQLPSLQSALQARRADFLATSQKRVDEIKAKDYTTINTSHVPVSLRLKSHKQTTTSTSIASSTNITETDSEGRQRRVRESKERSKRLYDQLAEVQQKKKFHDTKQQAQAYRARMNAFQTALDKKKTNNNNNNKKPQ